MHRGDIVALSLGRVARGHEQRGRRYAIVLQANDFLALSTVVVAPTSTAAADAVFRPLVRVRGRRTRVLVEQLRAVDRSALGAVQGHVTTDELAEVDRALTLVLGLF